MTVAAAAGSASLWGPKATGRKGQEINDSKRIVFQIILRNTSVSRKKGIL